MALLWSTGLLLAIVASTQAIIVNTCDGALRGFTTQVGNVSVDTFYNIPYAKPPLGELRFQKPVVNEPWTGTRDATLPGPRCLQPAFQFSVASPTINLEGQEDCLYLNVFTPSIGATSESRGPQTPQSFPRGTQDGRGTQIRNGGRGRPWSAQQAWGSTPCDQHAGGNHRSFLGSAYRSRPQHSTTRIAGLLPVMVWIHGGAFSAGSGVEFDGRQLASHGVVVVTVNYRLGALGFLSTEDSASPGNIGLHDQLLALRWVRDVICLFNGNPNDVTVFGESAGAMSISMLLQSKEAAGLFHKAIMQSGTLLCPGSLLRPPRLPRPRTVASTLSARLGCPADDSWRLLTCLRSQSASSIVEMQARLEIENGRPLNFRPVVEGAYGLTGILNESPEDALRSGHFLNVPVLRGFNKDEDSIITFLTDAGLSFEEFQNKTRNFVAASVLRTYPSLNVDTTVDLLVRKYVTEPGISDHQQLRDTFNQMSSDFDFVAPSLKDLQLYNQGKGKTQYLYCFNYRSANRQLPIWMGVPHADNLVYVFGYPLTNLTLLENFVSSWTDYDRTVARQVMTWWTNFAKFGNPTPNGVAEGTVWLPWIPGASRCLSIARQPAMMEALSSTSNPHLTLWNDVIPQMAAANLVAG